jgi:hypothetical protein
MKGLCFRYGARLLKSSKLELRNVESCTGTSKRFMDDFSASINLPQTKI